ncbi:uncharacterized protein LOC124641571 isoform X2 [Helicoverpa zea]|uniref:uncharacterized protein LOC124635641 isoform X2 n=1 Tax=Helicoverpa zea TaxID=7113 RepID=UPI001F57030F|nr:uncharacterized protein LOC124635641 isoform X2 [Helicoverpa zea]XP_047035664.1 uncharacterized protein LOC124641571 isoform X2 [Helicoverpa zea]
MSFMSCCVPGCTITTEDGVLHKFPNPNIERERFKRWVQAVGDTVKEFDEIFIYNNRRVCRRHFAPVFHYPKNRLSKLAIPTLFIEGGHLNKEAPVQMLRDEHSTTSALLDITNISLSGSRMKINIIDEKPSTSRSSKENMEIVPSEPTMPLDNPKKILKKQENEHLLSLKIRARKEMDLRKTVLQLKSNLRKAKVQKLVFKERLSIATKTVNTKAFEVLTRNMSKATKTFLNMQVTQLGKKLKGRRFTFDQKVLALSLFKASPKAYRYLSELFILPKRKTIQGVLQNLTLQPGINPVMMKQLKKRVLKMPKRHKFCTIIFDEMAIAPSLKYDVKNDEIIGFVNDGHKKTAEFADHVLVFMVRGVVKKYKQPIAYSFCAGSTKTSDLKRLIKTVVQAVEETTLQVVATICDQGATNVAAINALLRETKEKYLKRNEEWRGGFFEINNTSIIPLYDPPHLLKGVRNNLLTKKLHYKYEGKQCVAKWDDIVNLYQRASGFMGVTTVPKLTLLHVIPSMIPKMRVKHCTQVFSSTVAVAMGLRAEEGKLEPTAKETATILMIFDRLFDSVNGSFNEINNGKIYRAAVTPRSPHHKLWNDSLPILKSMKFFKNDGKSAIVPSLSSWVKTIEGFQKIVKTMSTKGVNSLLLRNFNQDPLENFFGAIRAHGASNIMPTAVGFQAAYKTLIVNNLTSAHSVGSNCEKDENTCLNSLKNLFKKNHTEEPRHENIEIAEEHLFMQLKDINKIIVSKSPVDREKCAAIGYCSGWLIKMAKKNICKSCANCKHNLESDETEDFHKFIKAKEYENKRWLCYPKRELFENFAHIEFITYEILKKSKKNTRILEYIKTIVSIHIQWDFISCQTHKEKLIEYLLNKNVLFCINNWCKEVNEILCGKAPLCDPTDLIKVQAWNHHQKYKLRKRMRQTGIEINV